MSVERPADPRSTTGLRHDRLARDVGLEDTDDSARLADGGFGGIRDGLHRAAGPRLRLRSCRLDFPTPRPRPARTRTAPPRWENRRRGPRRDRIRRRGESSTRRAHGIRWRAARPRNTRRRALGPDPAGAWIEANGESVSDVRHGGVARQPVFDERHRVLEALPSLFEGREHDVGVRFETRRPASRTETRRAARAEDRRFRPSPDASSYPGETTSGPTRLSSTRGPTRGGAELEVRQPFETPTGPRSPS